MRPEDFKWWQASLALTAAEAAKRLGKSPDTITAYRATGIPETQTQTVALAMAAVGAGLEPWQRDGATMVVPVFGPFIEEACQHIYGDLWRWISEEGRVMGRQRVQAIIGRAQQS